jgi:hypothetical protein
MLTRCLPARLDLAQAKAAGAGGVRSNRGRAARFRDMNVRA